MLVNDHPILHLKDQGVKVVEWQEIRSNYYDQKQDYFYSCLVNALDEYDDHRSVWSGRKNEMSISGELIKRGIEEGHLPSDMRIGRGGGKKGHLLADDFGPDESWRKREYHTSRVKEKPSPNWFSTAEFIEKTRTSESKQ